MIEGNFELERLLINMENDGSSDKSPSVKEVEEDYTFAINTIKGGRHDGFEEKLKRQKWYTAVATGEGYNAYVRSYSLRETADQLKKRRAITIPVTPGVIGKVSSFISPALRQPKSKNEVSAKDEEGKMKLKKAVTSFGNSGETLLKWVEGIAVTKNMVRPNDYALVKYDQDKELCFPEVLRCEKILNIRQDSEGVRDIIYLYNLHVPIRGKDSKAPVLEYTQYSIGKTLSFIEVIKEEGVSGFYEELRASEIYLEEILIKNKTFLVTKKDSIELPRVFPFGYIVDYNSQDQLYLPFWHKANFTLEAAIQDGSKFDVSKYLHLFLKSINYVEKCKYNKGGQMCNNGTLTGGDQCPKCLGTGKVGAFHGDMDKIEIVLPESEGLPPPVAPKDFMYYVDLPLDIVKLLKEIKKECYINVSEEIYGVDMGQKVNSPVTATQILEQQGTGHSVVVEFITATPTSLYIGIANAMAAFLDVKEPSIEYAYAHDVSIVTEEDLLGRLKLARDAGAPASVVETIISTLSEKQSRNRSRDNQIQKILDGHKPYAHLPDASAANFVLNLPETNPDRVLWEKFTQIATRIKNSDGRFTALSYGEQAKIIGEIVKEYIEEVKSRLEEELSREIKQTIDS
ncbi:MAG: hypothetical protein ACRBFS_19520 [Aureispira sp.]